MSKISAGTRVNYLELSSWNMHCESWVTINDTVMIEGEPGRSSIKVDIEDFLNNRVVKPETSSSESDEEYDILGPWLKNSL